MLSCNTLIEPACKAVGRITGSVTSGLTGDVLGGIAQAIDAGIRWIVVNTATWWVQLPSPDLAAEPAVARIQQWLLPVTVAVAVGGVVAAGARMALTRRANPLLDVSGGLLVLAAATTLGAIVPALLLKAGDAWSTWVLQASTGGHFVQRLNAVLDLGGHAASAVVLVFGVLAIVLTLMQAVLMLFRQAALIILAGVLPLAAAGAMAPLTRAWLRKVTAWMLALIFYKPAAAAVYATAFTLIGSGGSARTELMGFVMLAMSLVMLPALMKFFTWTTGALAGSGGGGGQVLGAAAMGAYAVGAMRAGARGAASAAEQAAYLSARLGAAGGGSGGGDGAGDGGAAGDGGGGGGAAPGGGPSGPAPSGASPSGGTPAGGAPASGGPAGGGPAGGGPTGAGPAGGGSAGGGWLGGGPGAGAPGAAGPGAGGGPPAGASGGTPAGLPTGPSGGSPAGPTGGSPAGAMEAGGQS